MTETEMVAEIADIRSRRPDIERRATPCVIVDVPADLACRPIQIAVHHRPWGQVEVDYREKPEHAWQPLRHAGGDFKATR